MLGSFLFLQCFMVWIYFLEWTSFVGWNDDDAGKTLIFLSLLYF